MTGILLFLTAAHLILLCASLRSKGITVLWVFNAGVFIFYQIGYWSIRFQEDIYFLTNIREHMEQVVPNLSVFLVISMLSLILLNREGVRSRHELLELGATLPYAKTIILFLSATVMVVCFIISLFIDWGAAPLFNIGRYTPQEMALARGELFKGEVLELFSVPRYLVFYVILPILFLAYGLGIRVSKMLLMIGCVFGLLTLAKTFILVSLICLFVGWWFRRGGFVPLIIGGAVLPVTLYIVISMTYISVINRSIFEILNTILIRLVQVPIALVIVYKEIFYFDEGLRSSYWYTLIFGGVEAPIQQIAGHFLAPNAAQPPNAACGVLGVVYPNVPSELHFIYFAVIIGIVALSSSVVSKLKNLFLRVAATVILGLQSLFILLTDPLTAFNSYGFIWSTTFVALIVYGIPFVRASLKTAGSENPETGSSGDTAPC